MSLSQLARTIKESVTLKLNETAALLREKGEPVIHLGGGATLSAQLLDHGYNSLPRAQAGIVLANLEGWKCEIDLGNHLPFLAFKAPAARNGRGRWPV